MRKWLNYSPMPIIYRDNHGDSCTHYWAHLARPGGNITGLSTLRPEAGDEPVGNRVAILRHNNGNRDSGFFGGTGWYRTGGYDDGYLETH